MNFNADASDSRPRIAVFGANPAWQKNILFPNLRINEVNRASSMEAYASGKGVNFCRAAACAGLCRTRLHQFADGDTGLRLNRALQEEHLDVVSIPTGGETRCCMTCVDPVSGTVTELIEPSHAAGPEACRAMLAAWESSLSEASAAAITGTLPDGTDPSLYSVIAKAASGKGIPLLLDAVSGIDGTLESLPEFILKVNGAEIRKLTGESDLLSAVRRASERWPGGIFGITNGPDESLFSDGTDIWQYRLPRIRVVNPIGSGDTCSSVFLSCLLTGMDRPEAFARGLAAASANCLTPKGGQFKQEDCARLLPEMTRISGCR